MQDLKNVKKFIFDKAQYQIEDSLGNRGVLKVDYKSNKYQIKILSHSQNLEDTATAELHSLAADLLKRKHGVNFANK
jgi:hypothetical protein